MAVATFGETCSMWDITSINLHRRSEFCVHDIFCHTTPPNLRQTICAVLSIPLQHIINSPPSITACHPQKSMCSYLSDSRKFELLPDPCELSAPPIGIRELGGGLYVRLRGGSGIRGCMTEAKGTWACRWRLGHVGTVLGAGSLSLFVKK
jgi:hypothetical protein